MMVVSAALSALQSFAPPNAAYGGAGPRPPLGGRLKRRGNTMTTTKRPGRDAGGASQRARAESRMRGRS